MIKKNVNKESGRSMVEMLGVLAVIGVLSVAGIAGYSNAMRSYRTNEIVNAVSTLYVLGLAQNQGNGDQELVYAGNLATNNPSGVTNLKYNANKTITMTISDMDDCNMVKAKLGDKISGECTNLTVSFGGNAVVNEKPVNEKPWKDQEYPPECIEEGVGDDEWCKCHEYFENMNDECSMCLLCDRETEDFCKNVAEVCN